MSQISRCQQIMVPDRLWGKTKSIKKPRIQPRWIQKQSSPTCVQAKVGQAIHWGSPFQRRGEIFRGSKSGTLVSNCYFWGPIFGAPRSCRNERQSSWSPKISWYVMVLSQEWVGTWSRTDLTNTDLDMYQRIFFLPERMVINYGFTKQSWSHKKM